MPKALHAKKPKPSVSIIGSGRLGTAIGIALSSAGYSIQAVVARRLATARKSAALISRHPLALKASELDRLPPSRIVLLTTPDDEIALTAERLADSPQSLLKGGVVLHTSGALSSDVLEPLTGIGGHTGSLHPLVSVSDPRAAQQSLQGAFYCIEGDSRATRMARAIVRDLKGRSFTISSNNKPLYHAAAVMASGHVVSLFDLATAMLVQCGLETGKARQVLRPLLESTLNNLLTTDPAKALTGTFARGDLATVQKHLSAFRAHGLSGALDVYRALGVRSLDLAKKNGVDPKILDKIHKALDSSTFLPERRVEAESI